MKITAQRCRAIVSALLLSATVLSIPTANAKTWSQLESYAWQGGNFACDAVRVVGPYWGAASYAEWNLWRIHGDNIYTRQERYTILALGAAQKCPEHAWIFTYQLPPDVAAKIAVPTPPA